ncbi:hypothetical protein ACXVUM_12110 [Williamsia sp. SKLECPSW1]
MRSFSVDQLLDSLPEVVAVLRDPHSHRGEFRPYLADCVNGEFVALWRCCLIVNVDPVGVPCWAPGGVLRGISSRTTATHLSWMIADLVDRMPSDDRLIHRELWRARLRSMGASPEVASLMQQVRDDAVEDEFAEFRREDGSAAVAG